MITMIIMQRETPKAHLVLNIELGSHWKYKGAMLDSSVPFEMHTPNQVNLAIQQVHAALHSSDIQVEDAELHISVDAETRLCTVAFLCILVTVDNDSSMYDKLYKVSQLCAQDCIAVGKVQHKELRGGFLAGADTRRYGSFKPNIFTLGNF